MTKVDWNATFNAGMAQPGATIRGVLAEIREARALLDKLDAPPQIEQPPLPLSVVPAAPETEPKTEWWQHLQNRHKRRWTSAEITYAENLLDLGQSPESVAEAMGRTKKAIQDALSVGVLRPQKWRPNPRHQEAGRRGALARGFASPGMLPS